MQDNKKDKYSFSFITFDAHKPPQMVEVKSKDYIIFGDDKEYYNNYPQYLLDNYNQSSTHNAICNGSINYISGRGLEVDKYNTVEDLAGAKMLIRRANEWEDADDLNRKIATDLKIFGGFYVEVIKDKSGEVGGYYHLDFSKIRKSKEDEKTWFYTCDWTTRRPENNEDFKVFHEFEGKFESGKEYLLEYRIYRAGQYPYALPDYISANASIEMEWRMQNFLLKNVKNGFNAGFIINFFGGRPTVEEQRSIEKSIKNKWAGDDADTPWVLNFNDAESKAATIDPIPTNGQDDRFNLLKDSTRDSLFVAHNVTSPMLFGVKTEGQLGGRNELIESAELFQNTYVNNRQILLEKFWCDALYFKGIDAKIRITPLEVISYKLPEDVVVSVMTQNEIREKAGLPIIEEQQMQQTKFSSDKDELIIEHFKNCGYNNEDLEVIYKRGVMATDIEEAFKFEQVTTFENSVLSILKDNPSLPPAEIAKALDVSVEEVMDAVNNLEAEGYLTLNNGVIEITNEGLENAQEDETFIVYKYALRPDAPALNKGGKSRPFCRAMMELSKTKSWTIEDIKKMRNGQGLDVFNHRGGWYTKKGTNIRVPYCRHRWEQQLVKIKR